MPDPQSGETTGRTWGLREDLQARSFNSIDILIAYMDREFNFIKVNDAYARAGGQLPEYFIGKNHFVLYPNLRFNRAMVGRELRMIEFKREVNER